MSAWICISSSFRVIPPSTRSSPGSRRPEVGRHRRAQVGDLVRRRLERRPRDVGLRREPRQPGDDAPRVGPPVRREQAGERRHEHDVARIRHGTGERLDLGGVESMIPRSSRSHWMSEPATATEPSSA